LPIHRFHDAPLAPERAHLGEGKLQAARVRGAAAGSGINFIDLVDIPPGTTIGAHRHAATDEEIYVVISGTGTMLIDGAEQAVASGDVIVNPPGGLHALRNTGAEAIRLVVIDVSTDGTPYVLPRDGAA